jgi:3-oxoacyl-[acyl-carrier protein] reductase
MDPRVMIVTGAASGIGRHLADVLLGRGHRLVATDLDRERLERHAATSAWPPSQVLVRGHDVRDPGAWEQIVELAFSTWGRLDVLFNIAGAMRAGFACDAPPEEVDLHLDVNAKGVIHGTRAAARRMKAQGHGHVVNIASMAAHCPVPGLSLYAASKFAVRGYSLSVAHELRPSGVKVTVVCPDTVRTPMVESQLGKTAAALVFSGPRLLTTEEVVSVLAGRVLSEQPMEVLLPRSRGLLARAAGLWPGLGLRLAPFYWRRGEERRRAHLSGRL